MFCQTTWVGVINIVKMVLTGSAEEGTEKIMASLKMGFFSSFLMDVFFFPTFFPFSSRYTFTKQSATSFAKKHKKYR